MTIVARSHVNTEYASNLLIYKWHPEEHELTHESQQEQAADKFRYITYGTLDDPEQLPPKGEFFCKDRSSWMPEIPGPCHQSRAIVQCVTTNFAVDLFHKQKIKE